ncbi:N-acetylgalactosamine-6-sulfate sulfatase [Planctomycetales bacterium 10988]|nr:N-acetylgalactosamine-6-sulfate sulfatase [Planctomycetales bacterium 10988]
MKILIYLWSALLLLSNVCSFQAEAARPNVVFIYADDWGYGDLSCHGHPGIKTPNLDQLAKEGVDYQQFTVCNPVCSPSRTAIMTGHFPARHRIHQAISGPEKNKSRGMPDWLDPELPHLPKMFQQAGYTTGHFGKWHLCGGGIEDAPLPTQYGYDESAVWTGPGKHVFNGVKLPDFDQDGAPHDEEAASYLSTAAVEHTLRFIKNAGNQPFFINLWLHETHHLVSATEADKAAYPDTPEPQRTYYSAVTRADKQIGRVLALLEELGKTENTIVVFSSDNGPENSHPNLGDKLYYSVGTTGGRKGRKRSLFMGGVGTPFIVRWPAKIPAGRVDDSTVVSGVDMYPTLLNAAGIDLPEGYQGDGENILAAWQGESFERSKPLFWEWQGNHTKEGNWPVYGMRKGDWQLLMDPHGERIELYDMSKDLLQQNNLADRKPDLVNQMVDQIRAWKATLPPSPPHTAVGLSGPPKKINPNRVKIFQTKDVDGDGVLSFEEYLGRSKDQKKAKEIFERFDDNHDGKLSQPEFVTPNG